jgi:hypothetical protein
LIQKIHDFNLLEFFRYTCYWSFSNWREVCSFYFRYIILLKYWILLFIINQNQEKENCYTFWQCSFSQIINDAEMDRWKRGSYTRSFSLFTWFSTYRFLFEWIFKMDTEWSFFSGFRLSFIKNLKFFNKNSELYSQRCWW